MVEGSTGREWDCVRKVQPCVTSHGPDSRVTSTGRVGRSKVRRESRSIGIRESTHRNLGTEYAVL